MSKKVARLYEQFKPENYQLEINTNFDKKTFSGKVIIHGKKVGKLSKRITLHQKDLKIKTARLILIDKSDEKNIELDRFNTQNSLNELRLHSPQTLYPGKYRIEVEFSGTATDPMQGLYPCYFNHDGKKKFLLATQFESHHAREVFPCIDEPEAKATFDLTVTAPKDLKVLGNMPPKSQTETGSNQTVTFEQSPIMSTYLLAFVIGEMHSIKGITKDGVEIRTWARVAQPSETIRYATEEGVRILEFFAEYFQTPYPLPKCDQVALPDFDAGAMENWGLTTFREIALLTDPVNRSQSSEQYVSMVIAHEMSHMWFGDLVTMKWWDDLWLNESFASLMEHIALDALHPDWHQWEQYTATDAIVCSSRDIYKDVQSVHVDVNHPDEIATLFDPAIVYAKGGRLLKMMREYIGDETFRKALKSYFAKFAYQNTVGDDLWAEMSAASGIDVKAFMDPWLDQSGMPVVHVAETETGLKLKQERFVLDSKNDKTVWPVPLLANDTEFDRAVLDNSSETFTRKGLQPVIINHNGSGHYLVHYTDKSVRDYIAKSFVDQSIQPESRINILNDMLLLNRRGDSPLSDALDLVRELPEESRDAVWQMISRTFGTALGLVEGDKKTEKSIREMRATLSAGQYERLGWDDQIDESPNDKGLRQTILSMMVASEDEHALGEALKRFNSVEKIEELPAEQRAMVVSAAVKHDKPDIDKLLKEYQETPNPDLQLSLCAGITAARKPEVIEHIIKKTIGEGGIVRPQDVFRWYAYLMRNQYARSYAWDWMENNWDRLEIVFGGSKSFDYFVVYSAGPINTPEWQKKFEKFFRPKSDIIVLRRNIAIALSEIEARVAWRNREEPLLKKYFN